MILRTLTLAVVAILLFPAASALAWNGRGHMMVAAVAWSKLTPGTKERVAELLKLNPDYDQWVQGVPASKRAEVAFMRASKWVDDIKSKPDYTQGEPTEVGAAGDEGYSDMRQHRYWHFKDFPFSTDGTHTEEPWDVNAASQIIAFRDAIGSPVSDDVKSYNLVWLIHLVGDVHQPLHATTRFSTALPNGDRGGNEVRIKTCSTCAIKKLHGYWDNLFGTSETTASIRTAATGLPAAPTAAVNNTDVDDWLQDSFQKAKAQVYVVPIRGGTGPYVLTTAYKTNSLKLARKRAALAGARLAKLIDDNLD